MAITVQNVQKVDQAFLEKELTLKAIKLKNDIKYNPQYIQSIGAMQNNISKMINNPLYEEFKLIFENLKNQKRSLEEAFDDCYRLGRSALNPNFFGIEYLTQVAIQIKDEHNYANNLKELLFDENAFKPRNDKERITLIRNLENLIKTDYFGNEEKRDFQRLRSTTRYLVKVKDKKKKFSLEQEFKFLNDKGFINNAQKKEFPHLHSRDEIIATIDGYESILDSIEDLFEAMGKEKKDQVSIKNHMDTIIDNTANLLRNYTKELQKLTDKKGKTIIDNEAIEFMLENRIYYYWRFLEEFGCNINFISQNDTYISNILNEYQINTIEELIINNKIKSSADLSKLFFKIYNLNHISLHNEMSKKSIFSIKKNRYIDQLNELLDSSFKSLIKIYKNDKAELEKIEDKFNFFKNFIQWRSGSEFLKISNDDQKRYLNEIDENKLINTSLLDAGNDAKIKYYNEAKEIIESSRELSDALIRAHKYNPYDESIQIFTFDNEEMNKGGQGTIQSGFDPKSKSLVVLKMPLKGKEEASIKQLVIEAKINKKLTHPNIIFCSGTYEGKYPIMENFPGENLRFYFDKYLQKQSEKGLSALIEYEKNKIIEKVISREKEKISPEELKSLKRIAIEKINRIDPEDIKKKYSLTNVKVKSIIEQICEPTSYLQKMNICHRDYKPENFMMILNGEPIVKLCDFGAAIEGTIVKVPVYSISYMAPENILGMSTRYDYLYDDTLKKIPGLYDETINILKKVFGDNEGSVILDKMQKYYLKIDTDEKIECSPGLTDMFSATEIITEIFTGYNRNRIQYINLSRQINQNNIRNPDQRKENIKSNIFELVLLYKVHSTTFSDKNIYLDLGELNPKLLEKEHLGVTGTNTLSELINDARHYYADDMGTQRITPDQFLRKYKEFYHRFLEYNENNEIPVDIEFLKKVNPYQKREYNCQAEMWYLDDSSEGKNGRPQDKNGHTDHNTNVIYHTQTIGGNQTINTYEPTVMDYENDATKTHMGLLPIEKNKTKKPEMEKEYTIPISKSALEEIIKHHHNLQFIRNPDEGFDDFRNRLYQRFENVSKNKKPNENGIIEYKFEWDPKKRIYDLVS